MFLPQSLEIGIDPWWARFPGGNLAKPPAAAPAGAFGIAFRRGFFGKQHSTHTHSTPTCTSQPPTRTTSIRTRRWVRVGGGAG